MTLDEFSRWFNRDFWRAFKNRTFPIDIPKTTEDRQATVRKVFEAIKSARYAPSIPEAEIVMNKGHGVARTVPVFCIEDYIVYSFCIKELESVISGNRTSHTFGGWTLYTSGDLPTVPVHVAPLVNWQFSGAANV